MIARLLLSLHLDRSANIMPLIMVALMVFMLSTALILNTAQSVTDKTTVQNAADASAILQADWAARSLNVMAMNNTALTQMFTATVVTATALEAASLLIIRSAIVGEEITSTALEECPWWFELSEVCVGIYVGYGFPAVTTSIRATAYIVNYDLIGGLRRSINAISTLNKFNDLIVSSYPGRVGSAVREHSKYE